MLTISRRTLLLWLFMFWQGGFLFYGAVVVTIGSEVLGSDLDQGMITRRVTAALNLTGALVLLAWIWDLLSERGTYAKWRWGVWGFLLLSLVAFAWLHPHMEALIDNESHRLIDRAYFRHLHRWYLRISTVQWFGSIAFTILTLQCWRSADRQATSATPA